MQAEHDAAVAAKSDAETQVVIHKTLVESTKSSLEETDKTILQLRNEVANLKASKSSVADILIKNSELTEVLEESRKSYNENDAYLRSLLQSNIDNYNNLAEFGSCLYTGFDADKVLQWAAEHPEEVRQSWEKSAKERAIVTVESNSLQVLPVSKEEQDSINALLARIEGETEVAEEILSLEPLPTDTEVPVDVDALPAVDSTNVDAPLV